MTINFHINNKNFYTGDAFYDRSPLSEKDKKASLANATKKCLTKKEDTSKFRNVLNSTFDPFCLCLLSPFNQKSNQRATN